MRQRALGRCDGGFVVADMDGAGLAFQLELGPEGLFRSAGRPAMVVVLEGVVVDQGGGIEGDGAAVQDVVTVGEVITASFGFETNVRSTGGVRVLVEIVESFDLCGRGGRTFSSPVLARQKTTALDAGTVYGSFIAKDHFGTRILVFILFRPKARDQITALCAGTIFRRFIANHSLAAAIPVFTVDILILNQFLYFFFLGI